MNRMSDDKAKCSFCGKTESEVRKLVQGPAASICEGCLVLARDLVGEKETDEPAVSEKRTPAIARIGRPLVCAFCGEGETGKLVAGPVVFICEECVRGLSSGWA
jgi:ATP-dependent protease Clp ATPase subunit